MTRRHPNHVVANADSFKCLNCGAAMQVALPCNMLDFVRAGEAFLSNHEECLAGAGPSWSDVVAAQVGERLAGKAEG